MTARWPPGRVVERDEYSDSPDQEILCQETGRLRSRTGVALLGTCSCPLGHPFRTCALTRPNPVVTRARPSREEP